MRRIRAVPLLVVAVLLVGTTGCVDGSGPSAATPPTLPGLVVSAPVQLGAVQGSIRVVPAASPVSTGVAYVSLAPGSVPLGRQATITNLATTRSVMAAVVDGGFDPVAIPASIGDTQLVEIARIPGNTPVRGVDVVRATRPPVVVRTSPPKGEHDVPLNASVMIVFSEPLDSATANTSSVQLWRGTMPVAGTVRFADAAHLRAEFHPDSLLAPQTDYQLVVTTAIRDLNGLALDSAVAVPFTTAAIPPATNLVFASVSAGYDHTCGVTTSGATYCWGLNSSGQLGGGNLGFNATPVPVAGGLTFAAVSAGYYYHTCGVTATSAAYCWGDNEVGELGNGTTTSRASPGLVAGGLRFAVVGAGLQHTCGLATTGAAYCWGFNYSGELGTGTSTGPEQCQDGGLYACSTIPVAVAGGLTFATVSVGLGHTCGLTAAGAAYCWGLNTDGRLGDGTTSDRASPVLVAGGLSFVAVSAGYYHTCGLTAAGAAYCWGANDGGQLGNGTSTDQASPVLVAGGLSFAAVSVGGFHTCGVTAAGDAYCWGSNAGGQLGDGDTAVASTPVPVTGGLTFTTLNTGFLSTCGVTTAGVAYCWGMNSWGQLGDGTTTDSSVPVKVAGQP